MNRFTTGKNQYFDRTFVALLIGTIFAFLTSSCRQEVSEIDHEEQVQALIEATSRSFDSGNFEGGISTFESSYAAIPDKSVGDRVKRYSFLGQNYCFRLEEYSRGIQYLDSALVLLNSPELQAKYQRDYINLFFNKGDLLFQLKKYNEAYQNFYKGKLIAQSVLDPCANSEYVNRLGMISYEQGKYKDAASYFKQCFQEAQSCEKDFRGFAMSQGLLSNASLSYGKSGMIDSAFIYSQKALDYIDENGKLYPERGDYLEIARAVVYGNVSDLHLVKGDTAQAESLMKRSIAINSQSGFDNTDAQLTMLKLGNLYLQTGELSDIPALLSSLHEFQKRQSKRRIQFGLSGLEAQYFAMVGDIDKAYESSLRNILLKDSIAAEEKKLAVADVDREFRGIEQQYKFDLVQKDLKLQRVYLLVALLFFVMTVFIILLVLWNGRISRRNIMNLTNLNKHITFHNSLLEQTVADLQHSNQEKDRILKVVAHDLRNPIGAIVNISSILLDDVDFTPSQREFMEIIQRSSRNSIEMINDLLAASLNKRPSELKVSTIEAVELIKDCVEQLRFRAVEKKQRIVIGKIPEVKFAGDREKLVRVLNNLIINAIKFSPTGASIEIGAEDEDGSLVVFVRDHGIGIPESIGDKVFDMFTEAKRRGTAGEQPFGIGLAYSKQVVEAHGGTIWFDSDQMGSVFYVRLPAQKSAVQETVGVG
jgi:signal transduction histidine kinase